MFKRTASLKHYDGEEVTTKPNEEDSHFLRLLLNTAVDVCVAAEPFVELTDNKTVVYIIPKDVVDRLTMVADSASRYLFPPDLAPNLVPQHEYERRSRSDA